MVEENKIFEIVKGSRKMRWKIVKHPYFPEQYAIVCDHCNLKNGECTYKDIEHIGYGGKTIEEAYKNAYSHT